MATVWTYPPRPAYKVCAKGADLTAAAGFPENILVVEITPPGLQKTGYRLCIVFAVPMFATAAIVWALYAETAGSTLASVVVLSASINVLGEGNPGIVLCREAWYAGRKR